MTPELLQRVAKCAPSWMGAEYVPAVFFADADSVEFRPNDRPECLLTLRVNLNDAACFLMMDAMGTIDLDGLGPVVLVELIGGNHNNPPEHNWVCRRVVCPENDTAHTTAEGHGKTRIEAIVEAFLKVFEKEEA